MHILVTLHDEYFSPWNSPQAAIFYFIKSKYFVWHITGINFPVTAKYICYIQLNALKNIFHNLTRLVIKSWLKKTLRPQIILIPTSWWGPSPNWNCDTVGNNSICQGFAVDVNVYLIQLQFGSSLLLQICSSSSTATHWYNCFDSRSVKSLSENYQMGQSVVCTIGCSYEHVTVLLSNPHQGG